MIEYGKIYKLPKSTVLYKNRHADEHHGDDDSESYMLDKHSTVIYAIPFETALIDDTYWCLIFSDYGMDTEVISYEDITGTMRCPTCGRNDDTY